MHCHNLLGSLSDYVDGDLEAEFCAEIDRHMAECGNCRAVVDTLRKTVYLYRQHGHKDLPDETRDRLYAVLQLHKPDPGQK